MERKPKFKIGDLVCYKTNTTVPRIIVAKIVTITLIETINKIEYQLSHGAVLEEDALTLYESEQTYSQIKQDFDDFQKRFSVGKDLSSFGKDLSSLIVMNPLMMAMMMPCSPLTTGQQGQESNEKEKEK